jgi:hypothetical protein
MRKPSSEFQKRNYKKEVSLVSDIRVNIVEEHPSTQREEECVMLQDPPRFFHLPSAGNERIVESYCLACLRSVGASPSPSLLKILEQAHHCMKTGNTPRAAATGT